MSKPATTSECLNGKLITCFACDGYGIVDSGYHNPDECSNCGGSGFNWEYSGGAIARYYSGPLIGFERQQEDAA